MKKQTTREQDPEVKIENALGRTELFLERNWKIITTIVIILFVVVGGVYAYKGLYLKPRMTKASDAMFVAQQLMIEEDFETALNGDGNYAGFLEIVDTYGSTPQGRLAAHYAGICLLKTGDADAALEYLGKYKHSKGIPNEIINAQNEGLKGDIYVAKGDYAAAVKYFLNAVDAAGENQYAAPVYLKKLAQAYEAQANYKAAADAYRRISERFPNSQEAFEAAKFAAAAEQRI